MSLSCLQTKFYIPRRHPGAIARTPLIKRLNEVLDHKLTLISAPAGYGKTTLLGEWVSHCDYPVTWLSLDESDNDVARFLAYLVTALQTLPELKSTGIGNTLIEALKSSNFTSREMPPLEILLTSLINELSMTGLPNFVLVLDDYHVIQTHTIHEALAFLLGHLPDKMHLVIATRADPPLPIGQLRARGQLSELRAHDLRFTPEEIASFFQAAVGIEFQTEILTEIEARIEGWAAGLQLVAIALQGQSPEQAAAFIHVLTGSHRYIMDYLMEEVFQRQPPEHQKFLLKTAILDRLSAPLCNAVVGSPMHPNTNQEVLLRLEHANLFITPLDDQQTWYRYHPLFADLLQQRLQQLYPDQIPTLHEKASQWYEGQGDMESAIDHAIAAGDLERATHMIEAIAEVMIGRGEQGTLRRWMDTLPPDLLKNHPRLNIILALILVINGQYYAAEQRLKAAEQFLDSMSKEMGKDPNHPKLLGKIAATRALMASFQGDIELTIASSQQALALLTDEDMSWRGSVALALGSAYRLSGNAEAANQALEDALILNKAAGNRFFSLITSLRLAVGHRGQGHLHRTAEICQQQLKDLEIQNLIQSGMAGGLYAIWGEVLCEWNDVEKARQYAKQGTELSLKGSTTGTIGWSHLCLIRTLFATQDFTGAEAAIQALEHLSRQTDLAIWITSMLTAWKIRIWIAQGNLGPALQLLQEGDFYSNVMEAPGSVANALAFKQGPEYLALVRLLLAQASRRPHPELSKALILLSQLRKSTERAGALSGTIEIMVLQSRLLHAMGDHNKALQILTQALLLAEPEGYIRVFLDDGPELKSLLSKVLPGDVAPGYLRTLLQAFSAATPSQPPFPLMEPLSKRELEILRFLATSLSVPEIAQELFVATSTVRSHIKGIYSKLNVHKRWDAVQRAKEIELL